MATINIASHTIEEGPGYILATDKVTGKKSKMAIDLRGMNNSSRKALYELRLRKDLPSRAKEELEMLLMGEGFFNGAGMARPNWRRILQNSLQHRDMQLRDRIARIKSLANGSAINRYTGVNEQAAAALNAAAAATVAANAATVAAANVATVAAANAAPVNNYTRRRERNAKEAERIRREGISENTYKRWEKWLGPYSRKPTLMGANQFAEFDLAEQMHRERHPELYRNASLETISNANSATAPVEEEEFAGANMPIPGASLPNLGIMRGIRGFFSKKNNTKAPTANPAPRELTDEEWWDMQKIYAAYGGRKHTRKHRKSHKKTRKAHKKGKSRKH